MSTKKYNNNGMYAVIFLHLIKDLSNIDTTKTVITGTKRIINNNENLKKAYNERKINLLYNSIINIEEQVKNTQYLSTLCSIEESL
ncbi:hypothetical protein GV51_0802 [Gardnerella vaginalis 5-1]|jgi:hypothetical protein|nr:hypothetical protein GV51_0802 [Gardnerella vaginalis 5-1]